MACFTVSCVDLSSSMSFLIQVSKFSTTIAAIVLSTALRMADNWVTTSLQSRSFDIISRTPRTCPSILRRRLNILSVYSTFFTPLCRINTFKGIIVHNVRSVKIAQVSRLWTEALTLYRTGYKTIRYVVSI